MKTTSTICVLSSIVVGFVLGTNHAPDLDDTNDEGSSSIAVKFEPKEIGRPSLMSPHASPIAVHGKHVFVVNTPSDTVDLIDIETREVAHRIPVGVDPVSIAVRPDGKEVWVSNHVSDSVSVIDSDPESRTYLHVVATIQEFDGQKRSTRFDEPVGIAFANNEKAYVALSSENQIAVVDVQNRKVTKRLKIRSQDPRQIVVRNDRLYVIPFESNNQTQLSGGSGDNIDGELVTFDAWEHSIVHNNVLSIGHVVDIVKHPKVPDRDLYVFDTKTDKLIQSVDTLGTLLYGMTVSDDGDVFIAQTDARNDVNGRAGTKGHGLKELENRPFLNRISKISFDRMEPVSFGSHSAPSRTEATTSFFDLDPVLPKQPTHDEALATPFAVEISPDHETLFVSAAGSDKLVAIDATSGELLGTTKVGSVPRGIALDGSGEHVNHAWVFNAVDNSVSLVDVTNPEELKSVQTVELADPTLAEIKRGRKVFNSAAASTTGTFSCASCHPDGHTDQLLWVLKTPIVSGGEQIMPRSTMPIRGLRETAPFHWDGVPGDPYGGNNSASVHRAVAPNVETDSPDDVARHLIDASQGSTMSLVGSEGMNDEGKAGLLSAEKRDDLAKFIMAVPYPPAQKRPYTNVVSPRAREGFELFHIKGDNDPTKHEPNVCGDCHRMPNWVSTNTPGTGMDAPTWRGAYDRWLILPQGRLNIVEFDFFERVAEAGLDERSIWQFSWAGRRRFDPVWDMVLEGSTGFGGSFARQLTLSKETFDDERALDLLDALELSANEEAVVLEVNGVLLKDEESSPVSLQFANGVYRVDDVNFSSQELIKMAADGSFVGTFTAHLGQEQSELPQPVIWTRGPIEQQRGHQEFPFVYQGNKTMSVSGRHLHDDAAVIVDGRRAAGRVDVDGETVEVELETLPELGMHLLQLRNPGGKLSNDFIFHVAADRKSAEATQRELDLARKSLQVGLNEAVSSNDLEMVKQFLERGAKVNARAPEGGSTPLCAAALRGHTEIATYLISKGARVDRANRDGNTPLHIAAFMCRTEFVDLLLENEADVEKKNGRGETPINVVTATWDDGLAGFYQAIANSSGFEIDLEQIEKGRKQMVERLRIVSE